MVPSVHGLEWTLLVCSSDRHFNFAAPATRVGPRNILLPWDRWSHSYWSCPYSDSWKSYENDNLVPASWNNEENNDRELHWSCPYSGPWNNEKNRRKNTKTLILSKFRFLKQWRKRWYREVSFAAATSPCGRLIWFTLYDHYYQVEDKNYHQVADKIVHHQVANIIVWLLVTF